MSTRSKYDQSITPFYIKMWADLRLPTPHAIPRALSSTKPSAHCMALATRFSVAHRKVGEVLGVKLLFNNKG